MRAIKRVVRRAKLLSRRNNGLPSRAELMQPVFSAIQECGGKAGKAKMYKKVVEKLNLPDEVLSIKHGTSTYYESELDYQIAWVRTMLKKAGVLETDSRGTWYISPAYKDVRYIDGKEIFKKAQYLFVAGKKEAGTESMVNEEINTYTVSAKNNSTPLNAQVRNINVKISPSDIIYEGSSIYFICGRCNHRYKMAPRCPECGQLVKLEVHHV